MKLTRRKHKGIRFTSEIQKTLTSEKVVRPIELANKRRVWFEFVKMYGRPHLPLNGINVQ